METSQAIILKTTRGNFSFTLTLPIGTTWADAVDAASELYIQVGEMAKQSVPQEEPSDISEPLEPTVIEGE
jgi:hypothetical protein